MCILAQKKILFNLIYQMMKQIRITMSTVITWQHTESEHQRPLYWLNWTTYVHETGRQQTTSRTKGVRVLFGSAISIIAIVLPRANTPNKLSLEAMALLDSYQCRGYLLSGQLTKTLQNMIKCNFLTFSVVSACQIDYTTIWSSCYR